jgi:integrase
VARRSHDVTHHKAEVSPEPTHSSDAGGCRRALTHHRRGQLEERLAAGGDWKDSGLVFTTPIGTATGSRNASREFRAMLMGAGLPVIRFHDLRHTAATLLLAQGVDPRTIMETLGHSQISLTLNTYSHVLPVLRSHAAERMDAALLN